MLTIAGGILLALVALVVLALFSPLVFTVLGYIVLAIVWVIAAPFMFFAWVKRRFKTPSPS